jgi:hypothetical protein
MHPGLLFSEISVFGKPAWPAKAARHRPEEVRLQNYQRCLFPVQPLPAKALWPSTSAAAVISPGFEWVIGAVCGIVRTGVSALASTGGSRGLST